MSDRVRWLWPSVALVVSLGGVAAWAQVPTPSASMSAPSASAPSASAPSASAPSASAPSASAPSSASSAAPSASSEASKKVLESCRENVPEGVVRPEVSAHMEPPRAISGHAAWLVVDVLHGAGEQLLPEGFKLRGGTDAVEALAEAFWFPVDPDSDDATKIEAATDDERANASLVKSTARIPFVPLPEHPGTSELTLPPVPIAVARANGTVMTVCTPHIKVVVDDPIANEVEPEVRPNPPPRPQRERWEALVRTLTVLGYLAPFLIGLAGFLVWWQRRPKPAPPKPQIPPWVTAMRELGVVRRASWLDDERFNHFFDRVDDITRKYLGERYGFDGLESTSPEIRDALSRVRPKIAKPTRVHKFLEESDFVKFAEVTPTHDDCVRAIDRAEAIVRGTMPAAEPTTKKSKKKSKKRRAA